MQNFVSMGSDNEKLIPAIAGIASTALLAAVMSLTWFRLSFESSDPQATIVELPDATISGWDTFGWPGIVAVVATGVLIAATDPPSADDDEPPAWTLPLIAAGALAIAAVAAALALPPGDDTLREYASLGTKGSRELAIGIWCALLAGAAMVATGVLARIRATS